MGDAVMCSCHDVTNVSSLRLPPRPPRLCTCGPVATRLGPMKPDVRVYLRRRLVTVWTSTTTTRERERERERRGEGVCTVFLEGVFSMVFSVVRYF